MQFELTLDAAVILSAHGPHLIETLIPPAPDVLQRFWSVSRGRSRHWQKQLELWTDPANPEPDWSTTEKTLVALFSSELLTRLACTLLAASDARRGRHDCGAIAQNVFLGHLECRKQALSLLLNERRLQPAQLTWIDQLRRRVERWTDVLLGHLVVRYGLASYTIDPARSRDFGIEQLRMVTSPRAAQLWEVYRISLCSSFTDYQIVSELDSQFRQSLVECLWGWIPPALFNEAGVLESPWVSRFLCDMEPDRCLPNGNPRPLSGAGGREHGVRN